MPFTFSDYNKEYIVKKIIGNEDVIIHLKRLGIIVGGSLFNLSSNGSGFIVMVNDSRIAIDKSLASKIYVEEKI